MRLEVIINSKAFEETSIDDFSQISHCIISSISNDYYFILPATMQDDYIEKAISKFNSYYRQNHPKYFEYHDHLRRMVKFLNSSCKPESIIKHCKTHDAELITVLSEPLISSEQIKPYIHIIRDVVDGFEPEIVGALEDFYVLRRHFRSTFASSSVDASSLQYAFLFSLIANSFVSESKILKKINSVTVDQINLQYNTITVPYTNNDENYSNIIMDELTAAILKSYLLYNKGNSSKCVFNIDKNDFNKWLAEACKISDIECFNLDKIRFLTKATSALIFPPYIVSTLSNKFNFVSLSEKTVKRISLNKLVDKKLSVKKPKVINQDPRTKKKAFTPLKKAAKEYIDIGRKMHQCVEIESSKSSEDYKKSLISLEKVYSEHASAIKEFDTLNYLYKSLKYNLTHKTRKLSTIKEYFTGFYKDLIYNTYDTPLDRMTEEDIAELIEKLFFERVLSEATTENIAKYKFNGKDVKDIMRIKSPVKIASKIRYFFDWYNMQAGDIFTELIYDEIYICGGQSRIRNTIITVKEFELILSKINDTTIRYIQEVRIIMILGFFAGMRISEIINLKIPDVVNGIESYIYVVKSKSQSGTRRIPLHYLVPEKYLTEILDYHNDKKTLKSRYMLYSSVEEQRNIKASLNAITTAIKTFIKDNGYVFHSLRHSFGSLLLIRYYSAKYSDFDLFLDKQFDLKDPFGLGIFDKDKLLVLFAADLPESNPNNLLWYISIIIGHLSPEITIENYMHTIEFYIKYLLGKYRLQLCGTLSKQQILNLTPTINSYKALAKHGWNHDDNLPEVNNYLSRKIKSVTRKPKA